MSTIARSKPGFSWSSVGIAAVIAVVVNLVIYAIARSTGWIPAELPKDAGMIGPPAVIMSTIVPVVVAGLLARILRDRVTAPRTWFTGISVVLLLLSFAGPFGLKGISTAFAMSLVAMHIIAALAVILIVSKSLPERNR